MRGWLTALTAATILVLLAGAAFVNVPGYTDADYYFAIGLRLSEGEGFTQPFIWNFLAQPESLPQPSHLYWMPLTSILASLPMLLLGDHFRNAQLVFILMAAALPFLSWHIARRFSASESEQRFTWMLAIFPGYFLPFFITTDAFTPFALIGAGALLLLYKLSNQANWRVALLAGLLIGLGHLSRADGFLLFVPAALALWLSSGNRLKSGLALAAGYLFIMGPWMARLIHLTGSPFPPGASRALWLRNYDELFSYPAGFLDPQYLLGAGLGPILLDRLRAFGSNLVSLLAVNHLVFLAPLTFIGGWKLRDHRLVQFGALYLFVLLIVMSFLFPLPGSRGGFFHSSAALMPVIWALAPIGLGVAVDRLAEFRGWNAGEAKTVLSWGMILIAATVTGFLAWQRLLSPAIKGGSGWDTTYRAYQHVGRTLEGIDEEVGVVAVNNPPGYWIATEQPAVVIPDGEIEMLLDVAHDFQVEWVVLEANHPAGLSDLYLEPGDRAGLNYIQTIEPANYPAIHLFRAEGPP